MIESYVIELLDIGDSAQSMDTYSRKGLMKITNYFRILNKYKHTEILIDIFYLMIFFVQILAISLINVPCKGDLLLEIIDYLKKVILFYEIITNGSSHIKIFTVTFIIILVNTLLLSIIFIINSLCNITIILNGVNYLTAIIYYYFTGPAIFISLTSILCKDGTHKYLEYSCFSNSIHLTITILSMIMLLLYLFTAYLYSVFCNAIDTITINLKSKSFRISCNYELYSLISKVLIFILGFFVKIFGNNKIYAILYEVFIFINCLIMSIYTYKKVYYYNNIIQFLNLFGWYTSAIFSFCIILKTSLNIKHITYYILFLLTITLISLYKVYIIEKYLLITEKNIFEFKDIKHFEMYKNILLNTLKMKYNSKSKIVIFGIIKKFEEIIKSNQEINEQYKKLTNDQFLINKFKDKKDLSILSIIFILYSYYSEKFIVNKEEIMIHMCYFLINQFNNVAYSMLLCSKLKVESFKMIYYKYLLAQDIKDHLLIKLKKNINNKSIRHVQIGSVIIYYLYIDLLKMKIYEATSNQIDYFDLLKNSVATEKTMDNFLKNGENILKFRKEIISIWEKMVELNPFSDEFYRDYLLYLDEIIQDEFLSKIQSKKYVLMKNNKFQDKFNIYHSMFLIDTSTVLLTDGYLSNGKILYATRNFPLLFMYSGKELLSLNIEDLLPIVVKPFHKELIDHSLRYSNIDNNFNHPLDSLLRNKNGGLFNIKLFVKPAPNLYYGLVYYSYLQKKHDLNFIFTLDKELKITGFTDMFKIGSSFTMNNMYNLSHNIIGYHIGLIIPDILSLLEFRNNEFNIVRIDYELKGYLYPIEKTNDIKNKLNIILEKIKHSNFTFNDYQGQIEDDPQNIINEFNDLIRELNHQNNKPFSIYYIIRKYTFLDGKYKYYRIYVNHNMMTEKDYGLSLELQKENIDNHSKINYFDFKSNLSKRSESKKQIKLFNALDKMHAKGFTQKTNHNENEKYSHNSKNINIKTKIKSENESQEYPYANNDYNNKESKNYVNKKYSLSLNNSQLNIIMSGFNLIKKDIINNREIITLKLMKLMCYVFGILTIFFMIVDLIQQKDSFQRLSDFLKDNLFFNKTKIFIASLYSLCVNIRWMSHSLYINDTSCLHGNWNEFYKILLKESLKYIEIQKNPSLYISKEFDSILNQKFVVEFSIYKLKEKEVYNFTFDNIITYIITSIIRLMDIYDFFLSKDCKEIPKEVGLNETKLFNLIEQTYNLYNLNVNGFTGKERMKIMNKNFSRKHIPLIIYSIFLLFVLIFYSYNIMDLHKIEIYFLEKLINFNSPNFEQYCKRLDEIKKNLRNDNREEDDKENDIDYKEADSKNKEEYYEEKKQIKKRSTFKDHHKKKRKALNKQNKIQQLKIKKLKIMSQFFSGKNLFFMIKIVIIIIVSLSYFVIVILMKNKFKKDILEFNSINDSIYGIYKDSYDIFVLLKRELDLYERNLINCTSYDVNYTMKIPNASNIISPKLGNLIMQITGSSNLNQKSIDNFKSLYSDNACKVLVNNTKEMDNCQQYWSGVLLKGMEQSITHMGIVIGSVINELQSLNQPNSKVLLISLINRSSFITYEQFTEYYLLKAFNRTIYLFIDFHDETLKSIFAIMTNILYGYSVLSIVLFIVLIYFIYNSKNLFNSFLNFICIVPPQYIYEDENLYREIIIFGNKYY